MNELLDFTALAESAGADPIMTQGWRSGVKAILKVYKSENAMRLDEFRTVLTSFRVPRGSDGKPHRLQFQLSKARAAEAAFTAFRRNPLTGLSQLRRRYSTPQEEELRQHASALRHMAERIQLAADAANDTGSSAASKRRTRQKVSAMLDRPALVEKRSGSQ